VTTLANRANLAQAIEQSATELAKLPTELLAILLEECAQAKTFAAKAAERLTEACNLKYGSQADEMRRAEGKDAGRVSFEDGEHVIRADKPKIVSWDQKVLANVVHVIEHDWKERVDDYVKVEVKVSEAKFNAWPPAIASLFMPARTVKAGRVSYEIERRAA